MIGLRDPILREKYRLALQFLPNRGCYVAAEVLELGVPLEADWIPTAAVARYDDRLLFLLNPKWVRELPVLELCGLLVHEALHVTHRHVFVTPPSRNPFDDHLYNLACDAVLNDLILRYYPGLELPANPVTGPLLIGRSTAGLTSEQVYALLRRNPPSGCCGLGLLDDHSQWDGYSEVCGTEGRGGNPEGDCRARLEHALREALKGWDALDAWGSHALGAYRPAPEQDPAFRLESVLRERIGSRLTPESRWAPPDRRLQVCFSEVLLPRYDHRDTRRVLLALDASGSVPGLLLGAFIALARRPVERCVTTAVTFDTEIYPFDPSDPEARPRGGGGTDFQPIETYAREQAIYPDVVVVLTDGWAPRPTISRPERWVWCLTESQSYVALAGLGERIQVRL